MFEPLFVPAKIAMLLKTKGFREPCMAHFELALTSKKDTEDGYAGAHGWRKGECNFNLHYFQNNSDGDYSSKNWLLAAAPTLEQCLHWLDLKPRGIVIEITYDSDSFGYWIRSHNQKVYNNTWNRRQATEAAIISALELIK